MTLLEIDAGNTRIKWRLSAADVVAQGAVVALSELEQLLSAQPRPERMLIVSVRGAEFERELRRWAQALWHLEPWFAVSQASAAGVTNGYKEPARLGADRWLALLAAYARNPGAQVVVDAGSAVTLDLLAEGGMHQGGYIAPGLRMMYKSLAQDTHAVNVPPVDAGRCSRAPGRDTRMAVEGAVCSMVEGVVRQALDALRSTAEEAAPRLIITGGDADAIKMLFPDAEVVPDLVLDGLVLALPHRV